MKKEQSTYNVNKLIQPIKIDGNWDKYQWNNSAIININNFLGKTPAFKPIVEAKMMYDTRNLYVIFRVKDCFVRCIAKNINGSVYEDACVEFFFAPDSAKQLNYFNLEISGSGIPLMYYNIVPRKDFRMLDVSDIEQIEIAHSLPNFIDPEITEPITYTVEYQIPLFLLEKYSNVTHPQQGVSWKANFYKCAENNSNPHWITWAEIQNGKLDFHQPEFFGVLQFQ